ncbi:hypothetical protein GCM10011491_03360 [Brucella endophytica]|uniref:Uncharacterized protein n=1 Tax=Brucella endophytica TaxID=1963359 RepID=A0A916S0R3_9HYPH|nr:hypothetical protein [Brucella endophytica]GGA79463.1 hypothetical protein GCM10011491_03360 [Brucella endophytica]
MTDGSFVWHPDQDDTYDGDRYGQQTLTAADFSAFNKNSGKSFTMTGDGGHLILRPGEGTAYWAGTNYQKGVTTQITIKGGMLEIQSQPGDPPRILSLGSNRIQYVKIDITGSFIINDTTIMASAPNDFIEDQSPAVTVDVRPGGLFRTSQSVATPDIELSATWDVNVYEQGSASIISNIIEFLGGRITLYGAPPLQGGPTSTPGISFEAVATSLNPGDRVAALQINNEDISCRADSISRLQAPTMSFESADIKVEDTASITISCDSISFGDDDVVFAIAPGAAVITFAGLGDDRNPFKFIGGPISLPKGLLNFLTETKGDNKGKLRFRGMGGSAFDHAYLVESGILTVNGDKDTHALTGWVTETENGVPYFTLYLKAGR